MAYDVAIVGTGPNPADPGPDGFAMGYRHAAGYRRLDDCQLAACADIVPEHAERFAAAFDVDGVYEDYRAMCREAEPDIVSVCVPPAAHAEITVGCARTGVVDAVHCEKPMATTWGDCREMVRVCRDAGVQLTINHQRRFGSPFRRAKSLLEAGAIGALERLEVAEANLYDAGSHLFDLCGYYTDQTAASWVLCQVEYSEENLWFGAHNENQAVALWQYEDGPFGIASTGPGQSFVGCYLRLCGKDGSLEIGVDDGPALRLTNPDQPNGRVVDTDGEDVHGPPSPGLVEAAAGRVAAHLPGLSWSSGSSTYVERAIEDVVHSMRTGTESELSGANALQATELIFGAWESARRPGRIDLPLEIDDNPLEAMVDAGELPINAARDR